MYYPQHKSSLQSIPDLHTIIPTLKISNHLNIKPSPHSIPKQTAKKKKKHTCPNFCTTAPVAVAVALVPVLVADPDPAAVVVTIVVAVVAAPVAAGMLAKVVAALLPFEIPVYAEDPP